MQAVYPTTFPAAFLAAALLAAPAFAHGQADAADLSFNTAVTSDYRYRGISQTRLQPAIQGGADLGIAGCGCYAGVWTSTIAWTRDAGGAGAMEVDVYGGRRGDLAGGLAYDVGVLGYVYPANGLGHVVGFATANTLEIYGQLSYGAASLKYSHALSNLFGFVDSKSSGDLDLAANPAVGKGLVLNLHVGRQRVAHHVDASYSDWKLGLTGEFGIVSGALAWVGSNAGKAAYTSPANGAYLGKSALQLTISKTF